MWSAQRLCNRYPGSPHFASWISSKKAPAPDPLHGGAPCAHQRKRRLADLLVSDTCPSCQLRRSYATGWLASGLTVESDAVGNVIGRLKGTSAAAGTLLTGSHYDTVVDAGKFDGRLGILLPIVVGLPVASRGCSTALHARDHCICRRGRRFASSRPFWGAVRWQAASTRHCSRAWTRDGIRCATAMRGAGLEPDANKIASAALYPRELLGFVEVHIEQGPTLLEAGRALGCCDIDRRQHSIRGFSHGHRGTFGNRSNAIPTRRGRRGGGNGSCS